MITIKTNFGTEVKVFAETFEYEAYEQIRALANYEAYRDSVIRIMPDAHAGKGCTVGTTMTIKDKVTPNLVGVDIGCGMLTVELRDKQIDCAKLDAVIREKIPCGSNIHYNYNYDYEAGLCLSKVHCYKHVDRERAMCSIGTLGGGNHFIEIDYSEEEDKYHLVIHTGSRKFGNDVCRYYQELAFQRMTDMKEERNALIDKLKAEGRQKEIYAEIKKLKKPSANKELAHLSGNDYLAYLHDMEMVQAFAVQNRKTIADIIIREMGLHEADRFETIHNYIDFRRMILRKGAVSAELGERLLIPINMRDGSLICIGKGNPDWNYSAPHGAGRLMSRSRAKETLSMEEFRNSMDGIYTTSVNESTIDEAPQAYKSMDEIKSAITDTVEVIDTIKPIYNFKASE